MGASGNAKGTFIYSPDDAGPSAAHRQPSRDAVPSSWVQSAQSAVQNTAVALTAAIALGTIWLLSRRK